MLPSSFPSEGILPRGGTVVLVDPDDVPKENLAADEEALGAEEPASEPLPNENPEVDAFAVVGSAAGLLLPNEKVGASFLLSLSLVVEPEKLKPPELLVSVLLRFSFAGEPSLVLDVELAPKLNEGAGAELNPDVEEAKLPNNCAPLFAVAVDGGGVDFSAVFLDSEEEVAATFAAAPNEKGFDAVPEAAGAGEGLGAAAGGAEALASLVAPKENPPEVEEVLDVEAAPNLKPPEEPVAVSLVADVSFAEGDFDVSVAPKLKPVEEDVLVAVVAAEEAAPNLNPSLLVAPLVAAVEGAPNEKPPVVDDEEAVVVLVGAGVPNENPLDDIFPSEDEELPPNEKPPLVIDPADAGGLDGSFAVVEDVSPALSFEGFNSPSQLMHFVAVLELKDIQTGHFTSMPLK